MSVLSGNQCPHYADTKALCLTSCLINAVVAANWCERKAVFKCGYNSVGVQKFPSALYQGIKAYFFGIKGS